MKTRITLLMSALLVLTLVFTGCSKSGDYENVIPKDAYAVASVDVKSIVTKCGLTDSENTRIQQVLNDMVRGGLSAETQKHVETLIGSPSETGLDLKSNIYIFASPKVEGPSLLMHVSDSKKLKEVIETLVKENICQQMGESDGYTFTVMGSSLLMFSKSAFVVVPFSGHSAYEELKTTVSGLLGQDAKASMTTTKAFDKMNSRKEDVKFYASLLALPELYTQQLTMTLAGSNVEKKDLAVVGGLNFGDGDIALQFTYYTESKEAEELLKKQAKASTTIDRDYISYFPKSTMAFASMGVNGKRLYDVLSENEELLDELPLLNSDTGKNMVASFDGDLSIGVTGISMDGTPTILAYAKVKNNSLLDVIYGGKDFFLRQGESIEKKGKNEYIYKSQGMTLYYGMKKKNLYATNDKQLFDNICQDAKPSLGDADFVKDIKGKSFFAAVDIKTLLELPVLKMMLGLGNAETQMYYNLASKVDYVEMSNTTDGVSELRIVLADRKINSLRQIVTMVGQFVGLQ
jgi:hypothetical protein